jgi:RNA polymerase sigma factor (sigma-70 family)
VSKRKIAELPLNHYHPQVGTIWRSRNDELEEQVFMSLPDWMDPDEDRTQDQSDICRLITVALETISPREAKVLQLRYFLECTLDEVGGMLELTRERIRQIEKTALRKMRHPSRFDRLRNYYVDLP